jgi:AAA domain
VPRDEPSAFSGLTNVVGGTRQTNGFAGGDTHQFKLVRFNAITLGTESRYLVKGLIPREALVIVWGPPKCGKTFWVFDLSMHIALDWKYRGRRIKAGTVVYIACEGEHGLSARAEAFRQAKMAEGDADPNSFC